MAKDERYPSDLNDKEWKLIAGFIPRPQRRRRPPHYGKRAILDSQSVKTSTQPGVRGYDAGKKVMGRKRHILVDTLGLILLVMVHSADIQDRVGARLILAKLKGVFGSLRLIWVDGGYSGKLQEWLGLHRRLAKDYEARLDHSEAIILIASSRLMLKRLSI